MAAAACRQHGNISGGGQCDSSTTLAGIAVPAAATAVLPPRAAAGAIKTPAATVMARAQTTIINQLKAATAAVIETTTMTGTTMTMETKAMAAAKAAAEVQW